MLPKPFAESEMFAVAVTSAPMLIEPLLPATVLSVRLLALSTPTVDRVPLLERTNESPLDAPKLTEPESVKKTFPDVLAVTVPAFVFMLSAAVPILPLPDTSVSTGVESSVPEP